MYRLLPIAALIFVIAGCGSKASSKTKGTAVPLPTKAATGPARSGTAGLVVFGTSVSGTTIHGSASSFSKPAKLAWVAHFKTAPGSHPLTLNVERTNGPGTFPRSVWSSRVTVGNAMTASGQLTAAQMKSHHISAGGHFAMTYTKGGGKILASGAFQIAGSGSGSHTGY